MHSRLLRISTLAVASLLFASPVIASPPDGPAEPPDFASVSTLAGSGRAGIRDGAANTAEFLMPTSVAEDATGNIYVCDFAAQRIREIARDGTVRTIAGGGDIESSGLTVSGEYRDGPAATARFNQPMGIAAEGDGTVYVADSREAAIRRIKNGMVTTYAGDPLHHGDQTGPAVGGARFERPVGLALDSEGNLYVADIALGIREVTKDGNVVVPPFDKNVAHPISIAMFERAGLRAFAIADSKGILYVSKTGFPLRIDIGDVAPHTNIHGNILLGYPVGLVMNGPHNIVYTDPRTNTIRYWSAGETRVIAGRAYNDPEHHGGGYLDGPGDTSEFFGPLGIAKDVNGGFVIADSSNRRIRHIGDFDVREPIDPIFPDLPTLVPGSKHILLIGNSFVYWDTTWRKSIGGQLESNLSKPGMPVQVIVAQTPGLTLPEQKALVREIYGLLPFDYTIILMDSASVSMSYDHSNGFTKALSETSADLRETAALLARPENVAVAIHPFPWEFSPSESTYHRLFEKIDTEWLNTVLSVHDDLRASVLAAHLGVIDLWTDFSKAEQSADRKPYFATNEEHFAEAGDGLVAQAIAAYLTHDPKWSAAPISQ